MFRWVRNSLFVQLAVTFLVLGLVSFGVNVVLTVRAGSGPLERLVAANLRTEARSVLTLVETRLEYYEGELREWSKLGVLDEILVDDRTMRVENLLMDLQHDHGDEIHALTALTLDGRAVASTRFDWIGTKWPGGGLPPGPPNEIRFGIPPPRSVADDLFVVAHPIRSRLRPESIGWLVAHIDARPLRRIVSHADLGRPEPDDIKFVLLVDDRNRIIAGTPSVSFGERVPTFLTDAIEPGTVVDVGLGAMGPYVVAAERSTENRSSCPTTFAVLAFWRRHEASQASRNFIDAAIGAGAVGLALATGAAFLVARGLTWRLGALARGILIISGGDLEYRIPVGRSEDEIGLLGRSFNRMGERLRETMLSLEESTARWRAIVANAPDMVLTLDHEGTILSVNHAPPGMTVEEMNGSSLLEFMPDRQRVELRTALIAVFEHGSAEELDVEGPGPHGLPARYSLRIAPIHRGGRIAAAGCIATDISEKRRLEREILRVSEEERERIGQDLHDGVGQLLTGAALLVRGLQRRLQGRSQPEAGDAERIGELLNDAILQTRSLARGLFPVGLDSGGLGAALEEMATTIENVAGVTCRVEGRDPTVGLDRTRSLHLFRIAQESVNNALRHARARNIRVRMVREPDRRGISVVDDGAGIDLAAASDGAGMGLKLMRYRARMIDASIEIRRHEGGGTEVACWL